jgi:hypothetical protein
VASCELAPGARLVARTPRQVIVHSGQTTEVVVELIEARAALRGRVVDEAGAPVAGVEVFATPEGHEPKRARTAANGAFEVLGLPPAPLRVFVDPFSAKRKEPLAWFGTAAQPEAFFGAPVDGVTLRVERGATLRVDVRQSADGPALALARVRLTPGPTLAPLEVTANGQGQVEIRHLRRGSYRLELLGPSSPSSSPSNLTVQSSATFEVDPRTAPNGTVSLLLTPQGMAPAMNQRGARGR